MFDFNTFMQKSPQQRFLLILGLAMLLMYFAIGIVLIFTNILPLDPEKFKKEYQIAFGIILILYGAIRFGRLINQKDSE